MKTTLLTIFIAFICIGTYVNASLPRKKPQKFISKAITDLRRGASIARTQSGESVAACNNELKMLKGDEYFYTEEEKAADEEDAEARDGDKKLLSDAIRKRLARMEKMFKRLMYLSRQLTKHINNINKIFKTKFKADDADMEGSQNVLNALKSHVEHGNPEMDPIVSGQSKPKAPADVATTSLLEVTKEPTCATASKAAYNMWNESHAYHEEMQAFFEQERMALGKVKEAMDVVIAKKRAQINILRVQMGNLKKFLAGNETDKERRPISFLAQLLHKSVEKHNGIVSTACNRIDLERPQMKEKRRELFAELKECKKQAGYLEDGVSKDEEFVRSKLPTLAWDQLAEKFDIDLDAKVTFADTLQTVGAVAVMPKEKFDEIADSRFKVSRFEYFKTVADLLRNLDTGLPNITAAKNATKGPAVRVFTLSEISV